MLGPVDVFFWIVGRALPREYHQPRSQPYHTALPLLQEGLPVTDRSLVTNQSTAHTTSEFIELIDGGRADILLVLGGPVFMLDRA